jgi:hypothetical protein
MKQMPPSKRIDGEDANVCRGDGGKEPAMRNFGVTMLAAGVLAASSFARAQTYSPDYPVCLHLYGPATHIECAFTSLAQCDASASGRAAQCEVNPFLASAEPVGSFHHQRRHHRRMHRMG